MKLQDLAKEFPREAIHWRAQTLTRNGDKALALAYLDARDVMDRLDEVCGPENWQDEYVESVKGRVICRIGIKVGDQWVWKSDGAGDTAVEGEKGGISDAYKRAAVKWGIGRYLYRLDAVWAPCETYEKNGKQHWKAWKGSPWDCVRGAPKPPANPAPPFDAPAERDRIKELISRAPSLPRLAEIWKDSQAVLARMDEPNFVAVEEAKDAKKAQLTGSDPAMQAPPDEFRPGAHADEHQYQ